MKIGLHWSLSILGFEESNRALFSCFLACSFKKLYMMGLFTWRCCGLGFLAFHKLQFLVEFCICTILGSLFLLAIEEYKEPKEPSRFMSSLFMLSFFLDIHEY